MFDFDSKGDKPGDEVIVNLVIPKKCLDMLDELAILEADEDRTRMLIKLIEKHYKIKKDLQQWQNDDSIRRAIKEKFQF